MCHLDFFNVCLCKETTNFACSNLQDPQRFSAKSPLHYSVNSPYKYSKIFLNTCQKETCSSVATQPHPCLLNSLTVMLCLGVEMQGQATKFYQDRKKKSQEKVHIGHTTTIIILYLPRAKQESQKFPCT